MIKTSKRTLGFILAATIGVISIGVTAPPALAADASAANVYQLEVNGQTTTLTEGETAVYPMVAVKSAKTAALLSPNVSYPGDGSGTITVTASKGVYHWELAMHLPATNFVGAFYVTDLTSGLGGGRTPETSFSGNVPTSKLHGHTYSGTLTGQALFLGVLVATTGPNNTKYHYTDY